MLYNCNEQRKYKYQWKTIINEYYQNLQKTTNAEKDSKSNKEFILNNISFTTGDEYKLFNMP